MKRSMKKIRLLTAVDKKNSESSSCCSTQITLSAPDRCCPTITKENPKWVIGTVSTALGKVLKISTDLTPDDYWGMIKCRISAFRTHYKIAPGLYAVGEPTKDSEIFATANYKMSFDIMRRELKGLHAWILVLDTKGINVWCAAGKGTFGTDELVKRISEAKLDTIVSHHRLILPQLGAVGVSAGEVKKKTGFLISFGPIQAADISAYIRAEYKKTKEMSTIRFSMIDRLILTPMEIKPFMNKFPWFAVGVLLFFGLEPSGIIFKQAWFGAQPMLLFCLASIIAGALFTPLLLPFIPFRSFAIKGWIMGVLVMFVAMSVFGGLLQKSTLLLIAAWIFFPALSSYIALQFTGSTTFTGMSGVKKELKIGIPLYFVAAVLSLGLLVLHKIREWGLV